MSVEKGQVNNEENNVFYIAFTSFCVPNFALGN